MPPYFFSPTSERPDDPGPEQQCRGQTYLESLRGLDDDAFAWSLSFVQTCRLAWSLQPPGFEFLEGRVVSLGIDRIGLPAADVNTLLHAVAGRGARVPGTSMVLRVARPWCALFEPAIGNEPSLPPHWSEGLEVHGDPASLWIGNQALRQPMCPALYPHGEPDHNARNPPDSRDLSTYEPFCWGWKLRDSPPLPKYLTGGRLHGS
jgi:hypothetical protein